MIKKVNRAVFVFLILFCLLCPVCFNTKFVNAFNDSLSSSAKGSCLMCVETGEVLFAENENKQLAMASTTKILTAIVVIESMDISKTVCVPDVAVGVEGSSIYLKKQEQIKVVDLLYGLMLRSGNDSAVALAVACAGSEENFAKMMNDKAKQIGAVNSNFKNPHGLDCEGHYTTAKDLALISAYALKNPVFKEICSTKLHTVAKTNVSEQRYFKNKNKLLNSFEGAIGVKTGYTKKCGKCLVSAAMRGGKTLVCVVLSCPDMWQDSMNILNFGFNNFS